MSQGLSRPTSTPHLQTSTGSTSAMNPPASSAGRGSIFTPVVAAAGFLHARQKAASQGDLAGRQHQGPGSLAEDEHQLESRGPSEQHERSPLLARAKSLTSALSMML